MKAAGVPVSDEAGWAGERVAGGETKDAEQGR
jgi:hypothetical protein